MRKNIERDVLYASNGLGRMIEDENGNLSYVKKQDCQENLKQLHRLLRRDHPETRDVFMLLGDYNLVQTNLIPLIINFREDYELVLNSVKVIVFLTMPIEENSFHKDKQMIYLQQFKETSLEGEAIAVIIIALEKHLVHLDSGEETEEDWGVIQLILTLFRNLLAIPDPIPSLSSSSGGNHSSFIKDKLIERLFNENVIDLVLAISQHSSGSRRAFSEDNSLIVEFMHYLFLGKMATDLFQTDLNKPDLQKILKNTLEQKKIAEFDLIKKSTTRHSRFGGMFVVRHNAERRSMVSTLQMNMPKDELMKVDIQNTRAKKNAKKCYEISSTPSNSNVLKMLKECADSFLEGSYNIVMESMKKDIMDNSSKIQPAEISSFFSVVCFFTSYVRQKWNQECKKKSDEEEEISLSSFCSVISSTMDEEMFEFVISKWRACIEDDENVQYFDSISKMLALLKEMILILDTVIKEGEKKLKKEENKRRIEIEEEMRIARILLYKIFYDQTDHGIIALLKNQIKSFNSSVQTRSYFLDLVECTHVVLRLIETLVKEDGFLQVLTTVRHANRKKKKSKQNENKTSQTEKEANVSVIGKGKEKRKEKEIVIDVNMDASIKEIHSSNQFQTKPNENNDESERNEGSTLLEKDKEKENEKVNDGIELLDENVHELDVAKSNNNAFENYGGMDEYIHNEEQNEENKVSDNSDEKEKEKKKESEKDDENNNEVNNEMQGKEEMVNAEKVAFIDQTLPSPFPPLPSPPLSSSSDEEGNDGSEEEKEETMEVELNIKRMISNFADNIIVHNYCTLLDDAHTNTPQTNYYVLRMLRRVCEECMLEPMLYQLSLVLIFYRVINNEQIMSSPSHKDLVKFIKQVLSHLFHSLHLQPSLFVDILFWKTRSDCHAIAADTLIAESGKKKKGKQKGERGEGRGGDNSRRDWEALGDDEMGKFLNSEYFDDDEELDLAKSAPDLFSTLNSKVLEKKRKKRSVLTTEQEEKIKKLFDMHKEDANVSKIIANEINNGIDGITKATQITRYLKSMGMSIAKKQKKKRKSRITSGSGDESGVEMENDEKWGLNEMEHAPDSSSPSPPSSFPDKSSLLETTTMVRRRGGGGGGGGGETNPVVVKRDDVPEFAKDGDDDDEKEKKHSDIPSDCLDDWNVNMDEQNVLYLDGNRKSDDMHTSKFSFKAAPLRKLGERKEGKEEVEEEEEEKEEDMETKQKGCENAFVSRSAMESKEEEGNALFSSVPGPAASPPPHPTFGSVPSTSLFSLKKRRLVKKKESAVQSDEEQEEQDRENNGDENQGVVDDMTDDLAIPIPKTTHRFGNAPFRRLRKRIASDSEED